MFYKAKKLIKLEKELAKAAGDKEKLQDLELEEKTLGLYEETEKYREEIYCILAKAIQKDGLLQGYQVRMEHGSEQKYMKTIECEVCGAEVFNILDKDYVALYQKTSYCLECALCGKRTWYRFNKVEFKEVKVASQAENENMEVNYNMDYEEEAECEQ